MARRSYGTGSLIVRRDGNGRDTWHGKWRVNGRQVKRRIGAKRRPGERDGLTRAQAEEELRRLIGAAASAAPVTDRIDIEEAGRRYVSNMREAGRKPSSIKGVESILRVWLVPQLGGRALDAVTPEDVRGLMAAMRTGSARRKRGGVGPATIRHAIAGLSAIYSHAMHADRRWATTNPCRAVTLPKAPPGRLRFLTPDELRLTIDRVPAGPRAEVDRAVVLAAAMTGLRQGELLALRWRDVDWHAGRVRVVDNYVLGEYVAPKSDTSKRSVPLADDLAGELQRWWQATGEPVEDQLVFGDPLTGRPLAKPQLLRRYRKALEAAGLDATMTFHELRHTFGTTMASAGVPMRTLQAWMGHADIATTQRYAHYAPNPHEAEWVGRAFQAGPAARVPIGYQPERISAHLSEPA